MFPFGIFHFWGFNCCLFWVETIPTNVHIHHRTTFVFFLFFMTYTWYSRYFSDTWWTDAGCSKTFGIFHWVISSFSRWFGNPTSLLWNMHKDSWGSVFSLFNWVSVFGPPPHRDFESSITSLSFNCFWLLRALGIKLAAVQDSCVRRYSDTLSLS